jgi:hypothetical protein
MTSIFGAVTESPSDNRGDDSTVEEIMKNVVGKPLDELEPLVGEWRVEGRHVALPNTVIHGRSVFEWWGDRTFLVHRSTLEHPDFPDSIAVIGATRPDGGLAQHYFDSRGVHRLFDMTFAGGVWTLTRSATGPDDFDQRMHATFSVDGNTIISESDRAEPGAHELKHDFSVTYTRLGAER